MAQAGRLLMLIMVSSLLYSDERASTVQPERRTTASASPNWVERIAQTLRGIKRDVKPRAQQVVKPVISIRPTIGDRVRYHLLPRPALISLPPPLSN